MHSVARHFPPLGLPLPHMLVKICGLRSTEAAQLAIDNGAHLLGVVMVPNRKRTCPGPCAAKISDQASLARQQGGKKSAKEVVQSLQAQRFPNHREYFLAASRLIKENGPFLVGVFRNQSVDEVFRMAQECNLDFIQLHGSENLQHFAERNRGMEYGFIKRYVIPDHSEEMAQFFPSLTQLPTGSLLLPLLDSEAGGEGKTIDWALINELDGHFLLAGGLNPENLALTRPFLNNVIGFDVSGGVEDADGEKDLEKIAAFIGEGKKLA